MGTTLGTTYQALGLFPEAEPHLRAALETRKRSLGQAHPDVAASLNNLASLLQARGGPGRAEPLSVNRWRSAQGSGRRAPGRGRESDQPRRVAASPGRPGRAEPLFRESLAIRRKALGDEHPNVAESLTNLAGLLLVRGDLIGASRCTASRWSSGAGLLATSIRT